MRHLLKVLTLLLTAVQLVLAQPGSLDLSFNSSDVGFDYGNGANGYSRSTVIQPDGKILLAGLTAYNGVNVDGIVRLNSDGTIDNTFINFLVGLNNVTRAIALQTDGKIILAGDFSSYGGITARGIVRLNANGVRDNSFSIGSSDYTGIRNVVIQSDGKIVFSRNQEIIRLNSDGSLDNTFNAGLGANNTINDIELGLNGSIWAVGRFTSFNGVSRSRIVRLNSDGSVDLTFNPGTGANGDIQSIAVSSTSGQVIIGGSFSSYDNSSINRIARIQTTGALDPTFNGNVSFTGQVEKVFLQSDGKILAGGNFTQRGGVSRYGVLRLNSDGSLDGSFDPGLGSSNEVNPGNFVPIIYDIDLLSNGQIILTGGNKFYDGNPVGGITRINNNGSFDPNFNLGTGVNSHSGNAATPLRKIALQSDGKAIIGGHFSEYNGITRHRIARVLANGSLDMSFDPGTGMVWNGNLDEGYVSDIAIQLDNKIVVGGYFSTANGTSRPGIARLETDGSLDLSFSPGTGVSGITPRVNSLVIQPNGSILVGGSFDSYNGVARNNVARVNVDGSLDMTFDPGTGSNGQVNALAIQADGKIIVGGNFGFFNGNSIKALVRLNTDGTIDNSFSAGLFAGSNVNAIQLLTNGKILVGGSLDHNSGNSYALLRLNADGSIDNGFSHVSKGAFSSDQVSDIDVQSDGKIVICGDFSTLSFNGQTRNHLARLNADGSFDISFDPGTGPSIYSDLHFAILANDDILLGGDFTSYNGIGRNRLAKISTGPGPAPCDPNWFTQASQLNNDSTSISWASNNASNFIAYYRSVNSSNWQATTTSDTSIILQGLSVGDYAYYLEDVNSGATSCTDTFSVNFICVDGPTHVQMLAIGSFEAVFSFIPASMSNSAWIVETGTPGFVEGTGNQTLISSTTDTLFLISDQDYELLVYEIFANGDTSCASERIAFRTRCFSSSPPLFEDFTAWVPNCWRVDEGDTAAVHAQSDYLQFLGDANAIVSTPPINLFNAAEIRFNWSHFNAAPGDRLVLTVRKLLSTDYDTLVDLNGANFHLPTATALQPAPKADFIQETVQLVDANYIFAEVVFELHYTADGGSNAFIDWFEINDLMICFPPTNLTAVAIDDTSMVLSWNQGSFMNFNWLVEYGPTGFSPGNGTVRSVFTTSDTIGGLDACTNYDFYVREICMMMSDTSAYGNPLSANTTCSNCTDLFDATATPIGNYSVRFDWNSTGSTSFAIYLRPTGDNTWQNFLTNSTSRILQNRAPGNYEYFIADLSTGDSSCVDSFSIQCATDITYTFNAFQAPELGRYGRVRVFGTQGGKRLYDIHLVNDNGDSTSVFNVRQRNFSDLTDGNYTLYVRDDFGCEAASVGQFTINAMDTNFIPNLINAPNNSPNGFRPTWNSVNGIINYQLRVVNVTDGTLQLFQTGINDTMFAVTNLPTGKLYRFNVRSRYNNGSANVVSGYSNAVSRNLLVSGNKGETSSTAELGTSIHLNIYPNPTNGLLYVQAPEGSTLTLIDMNGKAIAQRTAQLAEEILDLSGLAQGVYLLEVNSGDEIYRERVVKH